MQVGGQGEGVRVYQSGHRDGTAYHRPEAYCMVRGRPIIIDCKANGLTFDPFGKFLAS